MIASNSCYADEELLPISGLQHMAFCTRQCALIHLEREWTENRLTAEGRLMHDRVHDAGSEMRCDNRIVRGLRLVSRKLGLSGIADVVEFVRVEDAENSIPLQGVHGWWQPFPVEYKRGRPKKHNADTVQLCAQAMCLEEMLGGEISDGALFYGQSRKRKSVPFTAELRDQTITLAHEFHQMMNTGITPPPVIGPHCEQCSLREACIPGKKKLPSASRYIEKMRKLNCDELNHENP